jgi:Kef-type K+ transport system membrane component KefB/flavin reductase (DIM6/NTAB) family NADH-FMN oxidoreductase RutF
VTVQQLESASAGLGGLPPGPRPRRRRAILLGVLALAALAAASTGWVVVASRTFLAAPRAGHSSVLRYSVLGQLPAAGRFLLAIAIIVAATHTVGGLMRRLGQPAVIGEIAAGILLGPSLLGALSPTAWHWLLSGGVRGALDMASQLGLVFFMYLLGCELRLDRLRGLGPVTLCVSIASLTVPFLCALPLALTLYRDHGHGASMYGFVLFFGLAVAITALPVLARILADKGMLATPVGTIALTAAVLGDVAAWTALAFVLAVTRSAGGAGAAASLGLVCAFALLMITVGRRVLAMVIRRCESGALPESALLPIALTGCLLSAVATQLAGVHAVFGAFLFGAIMPRRSRIVEQSGERIRGVVVTVLLPLFFAYVGLQTALGALGTSAARWLTTLAIIALAIVTKLLGVTAAARICGVPTAQALRLGALMNCRGLTELIIAGIGLSLHLIDPYLFTVLVLVALVTTVLTAPMLRAAGWWETRRPSAAAESGLAADTTIPQTSAAVDTARLRAVLGRFATGVAVITTTGPDGQPIGMTVNSFSSVSLDPPLVLFCVSRRSRLHPVFTEAAAFAVNVLKDSQQAVSRLFARPGLDRFGSIQRDEGSNGAPLLRDTLARIECTTERVMAAGDHDIVIGRVCAADLAPAGSPDPLIFYGGGYHLLDKQDVDCWATLA